MLTLPPVGLLALVVALAVNERLPLSGIAFQTFPRLLVEASAHFGGLCVANSALQEKSIPASQTPGGTLGVEPVAYLVCLAAAPAVGQDRAWQAQNTLFLVLVMLFAAAEVWSAVVLWTLEGKSRHAFDALLIAHSEEPAERVFRNAYFISYGKVCWQATNTALHLQFWSIFMRAVHKRYLLFGWWLVHSGILRWAV